MHGRIIKIVSNHYTVVDSEMNEYECLAMGKVRLQYPPAAGDFVDFRQAQERYVIEKLLPRHNELIRPPIANIDQAIIVMSAQNPAFSCTLVDRILFLIAHAGIETIVLCVTKMDLLEPDSPVHGYIEDYRKSGYPVLLCQKSQLNEAFEEVLKGKVTVLTGQSGVGKSTLLNTLNPEFQLHTQPISKALGRGKHTTRHVQLHRVQKGWVADTPGFSSLDFSNVDAFALAEEIPDFKKVAGRCRFRNCVHQNEPGCAVKEGVEKGELSSIRYQNYLDILGQIQVRKEKY